MKRILSLFLAVIAAVTLLTVPAHADAATDELGDYLIKHIENYESDFIDISYYVKKNGWNKSRVARALTDIFYSHPELFYVYNGYTCGHDGNNIISVKFKYIVSRSSLAAAQKKLDDAAKQAVAGITPGMSDVEKALYIHDYIILNTRYDFSEKRYNAYNCLVDGSSVCQGYTLAYSYILNNYLGIKCSAVYSESENHIWNYVKIGNKWYHVDLTADDVNDYDGIDNYDRYGGVSHDNFLISDTKCKKTSALHRNWMVIGDLGAASDESFDKAFWNGVNSALCYVDGSFYYTADGGRDSNGFHIVELRRYSISQQTSTVLAKLKTKWFSLRDDRTSAKRAYGTKVYSNIYSSMVYLNGKLYFNSNKSVYSYDISTKAVKNIFTLDKGEEMQIFGMVKVGDKIRIAYRRDVTYPESYMKLVFG